MHGFCVVVAARVEKAEPVGAPGTTRRQNTNALTRKSILKRRTLSRRSNYGSLGKEKVADFPGKGDNECIDGRGFIPDPEDEKISW